MSIPYFNQRATSPRASRRVITRPRCGNRAGIISRKSSDRGGCAYRRHAPVVAHVHTNPRHAKLGEFAVACTSPVNISIKRTVLFRGNYRRRSDKQPPPRFPCSLIGFVRTFRHVPTKSVPRSDPLTREQHSPRPTNHTRFLRSRDKCDHVAKQRELVRAVDRICEITCRFSASVLFPQGTLRYRYICVYRILTGRKVPSKNHRRGNLSRRKT